MNSPSQGLPSPPPRSPATPSRTFPYTLAPRLPKVGTAKLRLRSNVFGLFSYIVIWWQSTLYGSAKSALVWFVGGVIGDERVNSALGFLENVLLFILLWNISEAIYVIYRTPPPAQTQPTPASAASTRAFNPRLNRSLASSLRGLSSPSAQDMNLGSSSTSSIFGSSSTFSTPTRVQNGSVSSLRYSRLPGGASPAASPLASRSMSFLDKSLQSSFGGYDSSPLSSYLGRHSPASGKALDGRTVEKLLNTSE